MPAFNAETHRQLDPSDIISATAFASSGTEMARAPSLNELVPKMERESVGGRVKRLVERAVSSVPRPHTNKRWLAALLGASLSMLPLATSGAAAQEDGGCETKTSQYTLQLDNTKIDTKYGNNNGKIDRGPEADLLKKRIGDVLGVTVTLATTTGKNDGSAGSTYDITFIDCDTGGDSGGGGSPNDGSVSESLAGVTASGDGPNIYTVRDGDTLYSLAQRFGTTVDNIRQVNGFHVSATVIVRGQELIIPNDVTLNARSSNDVESPSVQFGGAIARGAERAGDNLLAAEEMEIGGLIDLTNRTADRVDGALREGGEKIRAGIELAKRVVRNRGLDALQRLHGGW